VEGLEDTQQVIGGHARAVIRKTQVQRAAVAPRADADEARALTAVESMLHGVQDEVGQQLFEQAGHTAQPEILRAGHMHGNGQALQAGLQHVEHVSDQLLHGKGTRLLRRAPLAQAVELAAQRVLAHLLQQTDRKWPPTSAKNMTFPPSIQRLTVPMPSAPRPADADAVLRA
jgi:hypothetical protein